MSLPSWKYYLILPFTNSGSTDVTDYQLKLDFDNTDFDFSRANSDGSDIRFLDSDDRTPLNYWIKNWDSSGQMATIWVKVSINANSSKKIRMYFGNENASNASNIADTALNGLGDDFDGSSLDTSKWNTSGATGTWTVSDSAVKHTGSGDNVSESLISSLSVPTNNFAVNARVKENSSEDVAIAICSNDDGSNYYYTGWGNSGSEIRILKKAGSDFTDLKSISNTAPSTYKEITTIRNGSLIRIYYDGNNYIEANDSSYSYDKVGLTQWGTLSGAYWDWIFVRKYADPEPCFKSVGAERANTNSLFFTNNF